MHTHKLAPLAASLLTLLGCASTHEGSAMSSRIATAGVSNVEEYPIDHLALRSLIERFADAANHQDWAATEEMFAKDAVWEVLAPPPLGWTFEGRDAIRKGMAANAERIDLRVQSVTPIVVHVESPERATARSTLDEVLRFKQTGLDRRIVGTYSDQFVKQDGHWKFSRRTFRLRYDEEVFMPPSSRPAP
ncbi:nuclear transport factor 2 family protein [Myxococcus sp. CA051A]|uniref:nuclear transport factor 2 family protein n=1 Tax=Myxococcus sp. CA051A TaxID=2741739 RepID=UPI00157B23C6|nr:nuclear transport factor 2 family protein [Myxococcus sp. CA051A]NTX59501.1 nuclear transport factor 2 family protein [Myxococcus sp. CA051A]